MSNVPAWKRDLEEAAADFGAVLGEVRNGKFDVLGDGWRLKAPVTPAKPKEALLNLRTRMKRKVGL